MKTYRFILKLGALYLFLTSTTPSYSDDCASYITKGNSPSVLAAPKVNTHFRVCVAPSSSSQASSSPINIYVLDDVNSTDGPISYLRVDDSEDASGNPNGKSDCSTVAVPAGKFLLVGYSSKFDAADNNSSYQNGIYCNVRIESDW